MDSRHDIFDCIVLGGSPISMIEAICLAHQGKRVLLIDSASRLGGAWSHFNRLGYSGVENGSHLLIPAYPEVYEFMADTLAFDMIDVQPHPLEVSSKGVVSKMEPNCRFQYLRNGCVEMVEKLERGLRSAGVSIQKNTTVTKATVIANGDGIEIETDQSTLACRELAVTSFHNLDKIHTEGGQILSDSLQWDIVHLFLETSAKEKRFSRVVCLEHPTINYISDITEFLEEGQTSPGRLLTVRLARDCCPSEPEESIVKEVWDYCVNQEFVAREADLLRWDSSAYRMSFRSEASVSELRQRLPDSVRLVFSNSLTDGIQQNMERWKLHIRPLACAN